MAKIFIWTPFEKNVGHCSLLLSDGSYISFWPTTEYGAAEAYAIRTVPSKCSTYENDMESEGGKGPDHTIRIRGKLNNEDINEWWSQNKECGYSISNNCSTMVERALEAGGLEPNELSELQETLAEWREEVVKSVTGGGVKFHKGMKRL